MPKIFPLFQGVSNSDYDWNHGVIHIQLDPQSLYGLRPSIRCSVKTAQVTYRVGSHASSHVSLINAGPILLI